MPSNNSANPSKLRRTRLSEELTTQIRRHIVEKGLKPGDALLTEQEMAEKFGVSRSVVREATKALDFLGIIDATPRRGMVLDHFNFDRVSEYLGFHFAMSDYPADKLLKARGVIEIGSLYYTMEQMEQDPTLYPRLRALAEAMPGVDRFDEAWFEYDVAFHRALVEASGIAPLVSFCDLLQTFFSRFWSRAEEGDRPAGMRGHCQIVESLHEKDLKTAADTLRHHLRWYEVALPTMKNAE